MPDPSTRRRARRGRRLTTAAAGILVATAATLALLGWRAQDHAAMPPASAAHPAAEGNLPAPTGSTTPTGGHARSSGATQHPTAGHRSSAGHAATTSPKATPQTVGPILTRSQPTRLSIPAIGIHHTRLAAYGTDAHGAIDVPPATGGVPPGWYTGSPTPGQVGPSVIVGHTDAAKDGRSIFYRLGQLRPGDTVQVALADHTTAVFTIDSLEHYPKASFPTQTVYGNINHAGLRLISCIGKFDAATGHYLDNIVVYAHLTSSHHS